MVSLPFNNLTPLQKSYTCRPAQIALVWVTGFPYKRRGYSSPFRTKERICFSHQTGRKTKSLRWHFQKQMAVCTWQPEAGTFLWQFLMGSHYLPHAKVTPLKGFGKSLPSTHKVKGACPICTQWHKEIDQKLKNLTRQMSKFRNINIHVYAHLKFKITYQ